MKIGTMIFDVYGELNFERAVEHFITSMDPIFKTVSNKFDSQYRRFGFFATQINIVVTLKEFWKSDALYNTLKENLNYCFRNWKFDINLTIEERR